MLTSLKIEDYQTTIKQIFACRVEESRLFYKWKPANASYNATKVILQSIQYDQSDLDTTLRWQTTNIICANQWRSHE